MKLSSRWLRVLSSLKSTKKIANYEVVAGGVILKCNNGCSVIAKNKTDLETEIAQIVQMEEEK